MEKEKTLAQVKEVGRVGEVSGNFYDNLNIIRDNSGKLITMAQDAKVRIATAENEAIGRSYGTYTAAGIEYAKDHMPLFVLDSRLQNPELARKAVEANRKGIYFSTADTQFYEESLKQAEKEVKQGKEPWNKTVLVLPSRDTFNMRPGQDFEPVEFALRDPKLAKEYFELNNNNPMTMYLVDKSTVDAQDGTLLTQVWFSSLGLRSDLYGVDRYLDDDNGVRGVFPTAEGRIQKISASGKSELPYSPRQLDKAIKLASKVREGDKGINTLDKVVEFLESLRGKK